MKLEEKQQLREAIQKACTSHLSDTDVKRGFYQVGTCLKCGEDAKNIGASWSRDCWPDDYDELSKKHTSVYKHEGDCGGTVVRDDIKIERTYLQLRHVLRAITSSYLLVSSEDGQFYFDDGAGEHFSENGQGDECPKWNLDKDLEGQDDAVWQFLYDVIVK